MKAVITITLSAESRDETIHHFGDQYRKYREKLEQAVAAGNMGLPADKIVLRWLLKTGRWE